MTVQDACYKQTDYTIYKQTEYIQCQTEHIQLEN